MQHRELDSNELEDVKAFNETLCMSGNLLPFSDPQTRKDKAALKFSVGVLPDQVASMPDNIKTITFVRDFFQNTPISRFQELMANLPKSVRWIHVNYGLKIEEFLRATPEHVTIYQTTSTFSFDNNPREKYEILKRRSVDYSETLDDSEPFCKKPTKKARVEEDYVPTFNDDRPFGGFQQQHSQQQHFQQQHSQQQHSQQQHFQQQHSQQQPPMGYPRPHFPQQPPMGYPTQQPPMDYPRPQFTQQPPMDYPRPLFPPQPTGQHLPQQSPDQHLREALAQEQRKNAQLRKENATLRSENDNLRSEDDSLRKENFVLRSESATAKSKLVELRSAIHQKIPVVQEMEQEYRKTKAKKKDLKKILRSGRPGIFYDSKGQSTSKKRSAPEPETNDRFKCE